MPADGKLAVVFQAVGDVAVAGLSVVEEQGGRVCVPFVGSIAGGPYWLEILLDDGVESVGHGIVTEQVESGKRQVGEAAGAEMLLFKKQRFAADDAGAWQQQIRHGFQTSYQFSSSFHSPRFPQS